MTHLQKCLKNVDLFADFLYSFSNECAETGNFHLAWNKLIKQQSSRKVQGIVKTITPQSAFYLVSQNIWKTLVETNVRLS